eukprot:1046104-Amphidinium_carterae.1
MAALDNIESEATAWQPYNLSPLENSSVRPSEGRVLHLEACMCSSSADGQVHKIFQQDHPLDATEFVPSSGFSA